VAIKRRCWLGLLRLGRHEPAARLRRGRALVPTHPGFQGYMVGNKSSHQSVRTASGSSALSRGSRSPPCSPPKLVHRAWQAPRLGVGLELGLGAVNKRSSRRREEDGRLRAPLCSGRAPELQMAEPRATERTGARPAITQ
jgi:hypothetical protein